MFPDNQALLDRCSSSIACEPQADKFCKMYFQRHILYTSLHVSRQQNYLKVLQAVPLPRKGAQTSGEYLYNNLDNLKIQALFQLYTIPICKAIFISLSNFVICLTQT